MASITPIPTTRVSDTLIRQRLLTQLQGDQVALFRLQNAISTGRRISVPSEDAPAALRAGSLQSLLERKEQVQVNLTTNQSYLSATDEALSAVAASLADIRGAALSVADSTSSRDAKRAVAEQVHRAVQQLVDAGNQQFRDRFLFAGTRSDRPPFDRARGLVRYTGDESQFQSFSDTDLLFPTNVHGNNVFGSISATVQGAVDLNPIVSANTRLRDLHGGAGISEGSLAISDGANTSIIDISEAETVGDIKALIEANPPDGIPSTGRTVTVTITSTGLSIALNGGNLTIKEVGGGTTAAELGILQELGIGVGPVVGADLNPRLTATTRLADLPGPLDLASGLRITNGGETHVISLTAAQTVEDLLNTLNGSQANLHAQINAAGNGLNVRTRLSGSDFSIGENGGSTATDLGIRSFTRETLLSELNHGFGVHQRDGDDFQIRKKNGELFAIDVAQAGTIGDVIDLINNHPDNQVIANRVTARLTAVGNGLELVTSDTSTQASLAVLEIHDAQTAEDLGLIAPGESQSAPPVSSGGVESITGRDVNPLEVDGIFTSLIRLRNALEDDDLLQIQRSIELLDESVLTMNFSRAELGARQQGLDLLQIRLDDEEINLQSALSQEIDVDFAEVISELTARQAAYEASLQLVGRTFQLTLLDYL